jgi:hypothetical protein
MGPAEVLSRATIGKNDQPEARESHCYRVMTIGISAEPCVTECGIIVRPDINLEEARRLILFLFAAAADFTAKNSTGGS